MSFRILKTYKCICNKNNSFSFEDMSLMITDLDLTHDGNISGDGHGVRKNIALKLKPSPKGKRGRKPKVKKEEIKEEQLDHVPGNFY